MFKYFSKLLTIMYYCQSISGIIKFKILWPHATLSSKCKKTIVALQIEEKYEERNLEQKLFSPTINNQFGVDE